MKSLYIILVLVLSSLHAMPQDGAHYYGVNGEMTDQRAEARVMKYVTKGIGNRYKVITRVKSGDEWIYQRTERICVRKESLHIIWINESTFFPRKWKRSIESLDSGHYLIKEYHRKDLFRMASCSQLIPLQFEGLVTDYYRNGTKKSEAVYGQNMLQSNMNWYPDGREYIDNVFYSTHVPPRFSKGNQAFHNYIKDRMARAKLPVHEIQDEIILGAVVMETGELEGVRILKGKVPSVNRFFVETLEELPGSWEPAVLNGLKVRCLIQLPFNFINDVPTLQNFELSRDGRQIFWNE